MAFDWKKKFEDGKKKAADAFANAAVKGEELLGQAEEAASKFAKDVKTKIDEIKADAPKGDAPKNAAPKTDAPKNGG
ncbi:MAG: hypothetical protein H3C49_02080 [Alphaproteobacteria bacterium]|nr:hypothetical protein [Alphaproteobacteria bacterium]HRI77116.1 hypothetical protein [Alphaproteobacteria bacterium]